MNEKAYMKKTVETIKEMGLKLTYSEKNKLAKEKKKYDTEGKEILERLKKCRLEKSRLEDELRKKAPTFKGSAISRYIHEEGCRLNTVVECAAEYDYEPSLYYCLYCETFTEPPKL